MSDITMFPMHGALEHHILEAVAAQWDGTRSKAATIAQELARELPMRDAVVVSVHHRIEQDNAGAVQYLELNMERRSDLHKFQVRLYPNDWVVIWLHEQRLHRAVRMQPAEGDMFFRPVAPIITLASRRPVTS